MHVKSNHKAIDTAIWNNIAKDGMIHDIADYPTQLFKYIKGVHSVYPVFIFLANSTIQLIMQCSGIFTQPNQVIISWSFSVTSATFYYKRLLDVK